MPLNVRTFPSGLTTPSSTPSAVRNLHGAQLLRVSGLRSQQQRKQRGPYKSMESHGFSGGYSDGVKTDRSADCLSHTARPAASKYLGLPAAGQG